MEHRQLWSQPVDGATLGLAGANQIARIDTKTDYLRRGQLIKTTHTARYAVTSLNPDQTGPQAMLDLARGYWAIEIKQHYRRDHTQREDHCQVRLTNRARNLSLMRSMAIFLYERQRGRGGGKQSLPDWQSANKRYPHHLIHLLTDG